MRRQRRLEQLAQCFGSPPDLLYFSGDMAAIRSYADYRAAGGEDAYTIDDETWDDLDMDGVFQRLNLGLSNAGEQYLYYLLRTPAATEGEFLRRRELIRLAEAHPDLRQRLHASLAGLGRRSHVDVYALFRPGAPSLLRRLLYPALALALLVAIALAVATHSAPALLAAIFLGGFNSVLHHLRMAKDDGAITTVQYCAAMVSTLKALLGWKEDPLRPHLEEAAPALERLSTLRGTSSAVMDELSALLNNFFLLDLILFEGQKRHLVSHEADFFAIHRCLGALEAAISIASYRKSLSRWTDAEIDFQGTSPLLFCQGVVHPLVRDCVPNSLSMEGPILLTGSNASGKTTFLRTLALNLILAQSICTAQAEVFRATPLRVMTSIDISDSLGAGESYYVAELRALKRIVDAAEEGDLPVFCCLDEIFRGTNAAERIAAAAELLAYLGGRCLCAAATHDMELCALLPFALYHFEERIDRGEMCFDYRLKPGYATSSNAIRLLELMDFPPQVVARARTRAAEYQRRQRWVDPDSPPEPPPIER